MVVRHSDERLKIFCTGNCDMLNRDASILKYIMAWVMTFMTATLLAPSSSPAADVVADADQSSPKAAVQSFWSFIDRGDVEAARRVAIIEGDDQSKWVESFAEMCEGFRKAHDAAVARFGKDAEKQFTPHTPGYYAAQLVEKSEVREESPDQARVVPPGTPGGGGVIARRMEGRWFVDLKQGMKSADLTQSIAKHRSMAKAMGDVASNIAAGKYATSAEADQALREILKSSISKPAGAAPAAAATGFPPGTLLSDARKGFRTKLLRREHEDEAPPEPPAEIFRLVQYDAPVGKLAAYLSVKPKDGARHPAIIWVFGGFSNGIGETAWEKAPPDNDQSARAFREAGLIMMYPSLRGGNKNPGFKENGYGEVDDLLAAADFLAKQDFVDPSRIYLGGHSTGGTLVLLTAECTDRFRAVFCFGPNGAWNYGEDKFTYDRSDPKEVALRAPARWLDSVRCPVFAFEGELPTSNVAVIRWMAEHTKNPNLHFHPVAGFNHFSVLAPATKLIAVKAMRDTGPKTNISFTADEIARLGQQ
jgi:dienelactone hydrolase